MRFMIILKQKNNNDTFYYVNNFNMTDLRQNSFATKHKINF